MGVISVGGHKGKRFTRRPWRKILSDVDDTLSCSGGRYDLAPILLSLSNSSQSWGTTHLPVYRKRFWYPPIGTPLVSTSDYLARLSTLACSGPLNRGVVRVMIRERRGFEPQINSTDAFIRSPKN